MTAPAAVLALVLTGCTGFETYDLNQRSQPAVSAAPAAQPRAIDVTPPPRTAAGTPTVGTTPSLEERIQEYVKRFPPSETPPALRERPSGQLAQAAPGDPAQAAPPSVPIRSAPHQPAPAPSQAPVETKPPVAQAQPPAPTQQPETTGQGAIQPVQPVVVQQAAPPPPTARPAPPRIESVEIRTNTGAAVTLPQTDAPPPSAPVQATNQPLVSQPKPDASLSDVIASLERALHDRQTDPSDQFKLRLLYLLNGQDDKATAPAEGMSNEMATLLGSLIKTVSAVQGSAGDRNAMTDQALAALDEFRDVLRANAELDIPRLTLCRRVDSFGAYEEITSRTFPAGASTPVILYCEVENFVNEPTGDESFQVVLSQRLEILTHDGESQWEVEATEIEDRSRNRREDFFIAQVVHVPPTLKPGDYVLSVTIEDKLGAKSNEKKLPFTITSKP
jgi:hypothetical protein